MSFLIEVLLQRGRHCFRFPLQEEAEGWVYADVGKSCLVMGVHKGCSLLPMFVKIVEAAAQEADRILGLEGNSASFIMLPEWRNGDIYLAELQQVGVAQYNNSERILHSLLRRSELNHFFCEMATAKSNT